MPTRSQYGSSFPADMVAEPSFVFVTIAFVPPITIGNVQKLHLYGMPRWPEAMIERHRHEESAQSVLWHDRSATKSRKIIVLKRLQRTIR